MSDPEKVCAVVREWVEKAENDLETAVRVVRSGPDFPTDTVCFHAQQCVEKYLKALLVSQSVAFPKTHSIRDLLALLPRKKRQVFPDEAAVNEALRLVRRLTEIQRRKKPRVTRPDTDDGRANSLLQPPSLRCSSRRG